MIGQQRVIGLLAFLATPFVLMASMAAPLTAVQVALFLAAAVACLYFRPVRTTGIGFLTGTVASVAAFFALVLWMFPAVD